VIGSHFNADLNRAGKKSRSLNEWQAEVGLLQLVKEPTRERLVGNQFKFKFDLLILSDQSHCHKGEIKKAFSRLSNKKSSGMDNLSGFFVKIFEIELLAPLSKLFNLIKNSLVIPLLWKIAKIFPVHKKGVISSVSNYRPVSKVWLNFLNCVSCKGWKA